MTGIAFQPLEDLTFDRGQGIVGMGVDFEVVDLTALVGKPEISK